MTIGKKIKRFRLAKNLSQKQLALKSDMSEPAIRNYELGNRKPSKIQIEKIAGALGVSEFALSDPDLDTRFGIMQALFFLEDTYGFTPLESENKLYLALPNNTLVSADVKKWAKELISLKDGQISQEEYDKWRYTYPQIEAERSKTKLV